MEVATRRREQEVWQACDDLWALHGDVRHVTGDGIRERLLSLGKSKGSPNEIYKYRKTWFSSRGIATSSTNNSDAADNDPITRAVRLVHEQLKDSTENRIEALKEDFAQQLSDKEQALSTVKASLDQVLAEFGVVEQKLTKAMSENKSLSQQLAAEIDVRRALEKEMQLQKSLHHNDNQQNALRIAELKEIFSSELALAKSREDETITRTTAHIKELNDRMQILGHEYSERLMTLKTALINQELLTGQQESKLKAALENLRNKDVEVQMLTKRLAQEHDMAIQRNTMLAAKDDAMSALKFEKHALRQELAQSTRQLKKAGLTIARLRAFVANSHGPRHGQP